MSTAESSPLEASLPASGPAGPLATRSPFYDDSTPTGQVGQAFKRAMVAVRRLRGRETQRIGQLSYAQYGLLHGLSERYGCSARDLADHSNLSPATVTQMLESLENAGLVTRTRSAQDRRVVLSELTERGVAIVAERQQEMEERWADALDDISDQELASAAKVLNRVADLFESLSSAEPGEVPAA
jgi:DNA-binding MarR family transcriptional regulator